MKLQTSIEFIILLTAVSTFSLFVLGMYSGSINTENTILLNILNTTNAITSTQTNPTNRTPSLQMYVNMPSILLVNKSSTIAVVLESVGTARINSLIASGTSVSVIPSNYKDNTFSGLALFSFSLIPFKQGPINLTVKANLTEYNTTLYRQVNTSSYAMYSIHSANNTNQQYSAKIDVHKEALIYAFSKPTHLYYVTQGNHCSLIDFFGQQLSIGAQCGNAKWYFFGFDSVCYYNYMVQTKTYCVYLNNKTSEYANMSSKPSYMYNITLYISNATLSLHSNLTNSNSNAILFDDSGKIYGIVSVGSEISASGPDYSKSLIGMINATSAYTVNKTAYDAYAQRLSDLEYTLGYYNGSGMGGSIEETIGVFNTSSITFANAIRYSPQGCTLESEYGNRYYSCNPFPPFGFQNITVFLRNYTKSQTINVGSSVIEIK